MHFVSEENFFIFIILDSKNACLALEEYIFAILQYHSQYKNPIK